MAILSDSNVSPSAIRERTNGSEPSDAELDAHMREVPIVRRDIFLHPAIAVGVVLVMLALTTWWITLLRLFSGYDHPYTILYLIPVAIASAFLGIRGGIGSIVAVLIIAHVYLLNGGHHGISAFTDRVQLPEILELATLTMGTLTIAAVTGRLRSTLVELGNSNNRLELANASLAAANHQLIESERLRRDFNRDVLLAVTSGKLRLVEHGDLPGPELADKEPAITRALNEPYDASALRQALQKLVSGSKMDMERIGDLLTSTTEAATNAIKHANGGEARVWNSEESVTVLITDHGEGIAPTHLARATLEKGYSTRISLGMGFNLMLETSDALSLSTGEHGTSIMIFVLNRPRGSESEQILARYLKDF
ncbi:MAG: ATP-binding protein [Capsulimonadaceae bacterium]